MAMLLCEPVGEDGSGTADEATTAARAWVARQLRFEQLLGRWRAAGEDGGSGDGGQQ